MPADSHHEKTEYEFAAKRVNDLMREMFPDGGVQFMTFIVDSGDSAYLGYLASVRRIDAVRLIFEWLERMLPSFSREDVKEMLELLDKELADADR